jgi:hypothetical protein
MKRRRLDLRLRMLGRRVRRTLGRHYLTLASIAVISVLFATVMSSDSFVSQRPQAREQVVAPAVDATARTMPPRHTVLFFVVNDQRQLEEIRDAFVDDAPARAGGPLQVDEVHFLLAGTEQEEAAAITRLNAEVLLVQGTTIDLKVADVRGRFR